MIFFSSEDHEIEVHVGAHDKSIDETGSAKFIVPMNNIVVHEDYDPLTLVSQKYSNF